MTLLEFFNLMETTFSPLKSKENYLLELIDNLLQNGFENPLLKKPEVVHKITNGSTNISLNDAKFINSHSDTAKFEEYIEKERLRRAVVYLKSSNYTISEIASTMGYANQSHFITIFKKNYGCTPTKYLKKKS